MLELEERVDSLEAMFGRFIINHDKILHRLEQMSQQADQRFAQMQQQAKQDRERADQQLEP